MEINKHEEEQVKELSALIMAEIDKAKEDDGKIDEIKVKRIAADLMIHQKLADAGRRASEFETQQEKSDEELAKMFKEVNDLDPKARSDRQEIKMLQSKKYLVRNEGEKIGEKIENFKELNDDAYWVATMLYLAQRKKYGADVNYREVFRTTDIYKSMNRQLEEDHELRKALAVATSGSGAEWIPTGFSSQVMTIIELQLRVASLFNTVNMPTSPWKNPIQTSMGAGYYVNENTADEGVKIPASTPGTGAATYTAKKHAGRTVFSEEIDEDSIINQRAFLSQEHAKMIARAVETCIINGDNTGSSGSAASHQDNAGTALFSIDYDARLAWDGLRYLALNNAGTATKSFSNADPSDALLNAVRLLMGNVSVNPADLVWIVSINTYIKMLVLTNARTVDKYGPQATVLTGELMKYDGIPVVVSEYQFSNINASGVYDGSTTDRAMMELVYRPGFSRGLRGGVTLAQDLDIERDQIKLVSKLRSDFVDIYDATAAANIHSAAGYNIKTT